MAEVAALKSEMERLEAEDRDLGVELEDALAVIPNLPGSDVPEGPDAEHNKEIRKVG